MPDVPGGRADTEPPPGGPASLVHHLAARLRQPGLIVLTGAPGSGRSSTLRDIVDSFPGATFTGGGLAILRTVPGLALSRAVRARLPVDDQALTAEAVRSRVRGGLLVIDDLQWADPLTLSALPALADHCRVVVALRTPHRLPTRTMTALRDAAAHWTALPAMTPQQATDLARRTAPGLGPAGIAEVVARAGGVPLAVEALARHALTHPEALSAAPQTDSETGPANVAHAVAEALADLTRPARTAMAALGMLRRPAPRALLGAGVDELSAAGLLADPTDDGQVAALSPYVAEVAAGLLNDTERAALHRRLAELVPDAEAARHLAAAGDNATAYQRALAAAEQVDTTGQRADLLLLACELPGTEPPEAIRRSAAVTALAAGRPRAALRALADTTQPHAAVLRGEALLQLGDAAGAAAAVTPVPDAADPELVAGRDRVRLLAALSTDPPHAAELTAELTARHGNPPAHSGLRAALGAAHASTRTAGWERTLATAAAAAGAAGDTLAARWSAWLLVETLAADGRLTEAGDNARLAADACAADLAYSWQTRFLAAELWCTALRGEQLDDVVRRAVNLVDRTLPAVAHGYATAAASLAEADGGLLASARARLAARGTRRPVSIASLLDWVAAEAAWLDGQPEAAPDAGDDPGNALPLLAGLRQITGRWAAYDQTPTTRPDDPALDGHTPPPVRATLQAWQAVGADPARVTEFDPAATAWHDIARREEVRCLLAHGLYADNPTDAVPPLLRAETLAEQAGLVVLLGRTRRALRRHAVRRETRGPRAGSELTDRERDVLRLVAQGEPTRRIAGLLGISRETVETHIRAGMRKLGARTRTEAAGLALELLR